MRVLVVASQKGGSGRATLSGHLAVQAERDGAGPAVLIDVDPQGSLAEWWNDRENESPAFAQTSVTRMDRDLRALREKGFKLVVIDTPPAISSDILSVIAFADMVLIPTRPSPHDLRAVGGTVDLCNRVGKPLVFAVNAATPRARITQDVVVALSQYGTVAPPIIHNRVDFVETMGSGGTVMEKNPQCASATEIAQLWEYVAGRLETNFRRTVFAAPTAVAVKTFGAARPSTGFGRRSV